MSFLGDRRLRDMLVPGWLVEVVRPRPAPVPWAAMVRAAIAISGPLAAGIAFGRLVPGLLAAIGGLLASVVDRTGPYLERVQRVATAAVFGGAAGLIIGGLIHGHGWVAVVGVVGLAGVSALVSVVSATWSVTGLQLLVYSSFGLGPLGALQPWWLPPAMLAVGAAWGLALIVPGWILFPRAGEERAVADVYQTLGRELRAVGTSDFGQERRAVTTALNAAYDAFFTARLRSSGRDRRQVRLVALLNQAHLVTEAATTLGLAGQRPPAELVAALDGLASAIRARRPPPPVPPAPPGASPGLLSLHDGVTGAAALIASPQPTPAGRDPGGKDRSGEGNRQAGRPGAREWARAVWRQRIPGVLEAFRGGRLVWVFAARLMLCVGAAAVVSEVAPVQRSYWVVLTVAIVLKPDFGSVFARALQRGIGTVVGAVAGAVIVVVVPYGPLLLIPVAVFAALLPYGRSRNYGLFSVFLTPLVVLLIDLLVRGGWRLAEDRLIDTLIGCGIVLLLGYALWPGSWYVDLPRKFAGTVDGVAGYLERALAPAGPPGAGERRPAGPGVAPGMRPGARSRLRRQTYRALSDLRAEFQRTMAEPAAISRRATAWWPALVSLENVMDAATAGAVALDHGATPAPAAAVRDLAGALRGVAGSVRTGDPSAARAAVPRQEQLAPVAEAVRAVQGAFRGSDSD